jgi:hypothetical protein
MARVLCVSRLCDGQQSIGAWQGMQFGVMLPGDGEMCCEMQDQNASLESRCNAAGGEGHDSVREEAAQRVATAERMVC